MALKEKARNVREHGARTVDIDTNGNNYLGTTSTGTKGVTVSVNITSGTATDFDLGYAVNNTANDASPTVVAYESGEITATGGDISVLSGGNKDIYLIVAGASSLVATADLNEFS